MPRLDQSSFLETFGSSMRQVAADNLPPFDFWSYFEQIPEADFEGYDCTEGQVNWVWRTEDGRYEHVLISTREDTEVYMVLVLDRNAEAVFGHKILNLKNEYEIDKQSLD